MSRPPFIAVADDLTGAAEIAALGFRHGLAAAIMFDAAEADAEADLLVFDSDSRLDEPRRAAKKLSSLGRVLAPHPRELLYKKTDSVLRGPVRAEVEALSAALGLPRVLLLPANPSLGRCIRNGRYAIDGVPLHRTAFARDPHHPAKSDSVPSLLGDTGSLPVTVRNTTDSLPKKGVVVCNAASAGEVQSWARQLATVDLPAGGGDFFSALLLQRGLTPVTRAVPFQPGSPTLIVSGTTSAAGLALRDQARRDGLAVMAMPAAITGEGREAASGAAGWIQTVHARLAEERVVVAVFDGPIVAGPHVAGAIRGAFAKCVGELVQRGALQHLIVEGGATAAAITRAMGWRELRVAHEWAHGVASLRPVNHASLVLTLKPGSYAWPATLWQRILEARSRVPPVVRERSLS